MGLLDRLREIPERIGRGGERAEGPGQAPTKPWQSPTDPVRARVQAGRPTRSASLAANPNARISNSLKDLLWLIGEVKNGRVLDLGQVSQATLNFFIERGFKVYSEDLLRSWREHRAAEEAAQSGAPTVEQGAEELLRKAKVERFIAANLKYPADTFHAVLVWDLLDYLDTELLRPVVERLHEVLRTGGAILALFHARRPEKFHRFRVLDGETIEMFAAPALAGQQRVFQNRELLSLFEAFKSSKTFMGRDQIREGLFLK